jgi:hypothetical protein
MGVSMTTQVAEAHSAKAEPVGAAREIASQVRARLGGRTPRGAILYAHSAVEVAELLSQLRGELGPVPIAGCTSCLGVGGSATNGDGTAVGSLWLGGDEVGFGVAQVETNRGEETGVQLAREAIAAAGLDAGAVSFAFLHATPGHEETLLRGIYQVLPPETPLLGGSAADDDLSGRWRVWGGGRPGAGAALAVCGWPGRFGAAFRSGYLTTGRSGVVTRADGRVLHEIDGRPAAEVYNDWCRGALGDGMAPGGPVLAKTTLRPLGVARTSVLGIEVHLLLHPERVVLPGPSLQLFAPVKAGDTVKLMSSNPDSLVLRPAEVAQQAMRSGRLARGEVIGSMMVYCGGCLLAIRERRSEMVQNYRAAVGHAPSVATFSFGEQGSIVPRQCEHGNLMASVLVLSGRAG